jgi:hypothetical protein
MSRRDGIHADAAGDAGIQAAYRYHPPPQGSSFPVTGPASVASVAERLSRQ